MSTLTRFVRRSPAYSLWILFLVGMFGIGVIAILSVLINGLSVTELTNQLPWGLWITVDLSSIALGAGAFTLSAAVYIFGMKEYESIARAAVLIGLLGYTGAMMALFVDIGRPDPLPRMTTGERPILAHRAQTRIVRSSQSPAPARSVCALRACWSVPFGSGV